MPLAECGDPEGGMNESALEIKKMHERLSKNYLSVNFSTIHLTMLINGAITVACSGGRAKERAARFPGKPFRMNNIKIFDPTRTPGLEE